MAGSLARGLLWRRELWRLLADLPGFLAESRKAEAPDEEGYPGHLHINLLPESRGRAVGVRLVECFFEEARRHQLPGVRAVVYETNQPARRFFERLGFRPLGRQPAFKPPPEDGGREWKIVYGKELVRGSDGSPLESPVVDFSGDSMKRTFATLAILALALCQIAFAAVPKSAAPKAAASQGNAIAKAKALFARYVQLEHAFDPAMADLYTDQAVIVNKRIYKDGKVTSLQIPALRYKHVIRSGMAGAKKQGDISNYTNDSYAPEGSKVRINVTRYSVLKKYCQPDVPPGRPGPDGQVGHLRGEERVAPVGR